MACIEAVIADHFEVLFGDVADQFFDELHGRDGFMDKDIVFVPIVVEGNGVGSLVIGINAGSGDHRTAKVAADILQNSRSIAFVVFSIDIETILGIAVNGGLDSLEFGRESLLEKIQENGLESLAEEGVVEMGDRAPETEFVDGAFRDKAVNVGIPF